MRSHTPASQPLGCSVLVSFGTNIILCQADTAGADAVTPLSPFPSGNEKGLQAEMTAMIKKRTFFGRGRLKEGKGLTQSCKEENMSELEAF